MLSYLYDISPLSSTDWSIIGLLLDMIGAFLIAKIIVLNPYSKEVSKTFWGANPFAIKTSIMSKTDTLIGCMALMLGFLFQGIGTVFNYLGIPKPSLILTNRVGLIWTILGGLFIFIVVIRISSFVSLRKYRREYSSEYLNHIDEALLTVEAGYIRSDLRGKSSDELKQISNLAVVVSSTKESVSNLIETVSKLFAIKLKDDGDRSNLALIKSKLEGWLK